MKSFFVFLIGACAFMYLLNLSFGVVQLPDNLPIIGNIDEAVAAGLLINSMKYFGIDVTNLFKRKQPEFTERKKLQ